jgi:hypothetical protein
MIVQRYTHDRCALLAERWPRALPIGMFDFHIEQLRRGMTATWRKALGPMIHLLEP